MNVARLMSISVKERFSWSTKLLRCLQKSCDVSIAKCKRLKTVRVICRLWNMVRHDHVRIANLLISLDRLDEIDIAFVRKGFYKIIGMTANVAKVDVEYLLSGAKVTDHIKEFFCWSFKHL